MGHRAKHLRALATLGQPWLTLCDLALGTSLPVYPYGPRDYAYAKEQAEREVENWGSGQARSETCALEAAPSRQRTLLGSADCSCQSSRLRAPDHVWEGLTSVKRLLNSCSLMPYRCLLFASGFKDIVPSTETHSARPALMRQLEPI